MNTGNRNRQESKSPFYVFNDVETTGFDWLRNDVIVWSSIVTDKSLQILDKATFKIKPEGVDFFGGEKVHGISYFQSLTHDDRRDAVIGIMNFLKPFKTNYPATFIEHSVNYFDFKFNMGLFMKENLEFSMRKMFQQRYSVSTIDMAKKMGYKKNKLNEWAKRVNFTLDHHNAESDVMCTVEVFKYLKGMN